MDPNRQEMKDKAVEAERNEQQIVRYDTKTRRRFLLSTSAVGLTGLAGCLGSGGETTTSSGDGGGSNGNSGETTTGGGNTSIEGTELVYWNSINPNSEQARVRSEYLVETFREQTGANLKVSWESPAGSFKGEWLNQMSEENYPNYPVIYDGLLNFGGQYMANDFVEPIGNYKQWLDDCILENMPTMLDAYQEALSPFGVSSHDEVLEVPIGIQTQNPFVARKDHFEKAGLSWEDDFPPKDYDHLISVGKTLQKDGPADYGFPVYATTTDALDELLTCWAVTIGGKDGDFLNSDGTETNFGNDVWEKALQRYNDIQHKYDLSFKGAPTAGDEDVMNQLIKGTTSLGAINWLDIPGLLNRAPDMMDDGTIQFAPMWKGESGSRGIFHPWSIAITTPPENVSKSKWRQKQKAATEFLNMWLSESQQKRMFTDFGIFPAREDVWDQISAAPYKGPKVLKTMTKDMETTWTSHESLIDIQYNKTAPIIQQMLNGDIGASEANKKLKDTTENIMSN